MPFSLPFCTSAPFPSILHLCLPPLHPVTPQRCLPPSVGPRPEGQRGPTGGPAAAGIGGGRRGRGRPRSNTDRRPAGTSARRHQRWRIHPCCGPQRGEAGAGQRLRRAALPAAGRQPPCGRQHARAVQHQTRGCEAGAAAHHHAAHARHGGGHGGTGARSGHAVQALYWLGTQAYFPSPLTFHPM
eukprot:111831-Chlamydomonas_euryale.AAC.3